MTRRGRRCGAVITLAVALTAAGAQPAAAKITFGGIGDVDLGMSEGDLRAALGQPSTAQTGGRPDGTAHLMFRRRKLEVMVNRRRDQVVGIKTTSRAERTSSGLRVGSSTATVRRKLRGEKCSTAQRTLVCNVERDGNVMDFEIRGGKVVRVGVARANRN